MASDIYKHFVILGFLAYWPAALYMITKWHGGRKMTFSLHAASNKPARQLFAAAVTVETICYTLFAYKWFIPHFKMSWLFSVLIGLTLLGHFISGVIPETKGWRRQVHRKASYTVAWLFLPLLLILISTSSISTTAVLIGAMLLAIDLAIWFAFFIKPGKRQEDLWGQAIYISSLPIVLMAATYIK